MDTYVENTGAAEQEKQIQVVPMENEHQIQARNGRRSMTKARNWRKILISFERRNRIRSAEKPQICQ